MNPTTRHLLVTTGTFVLGAGLGVLYSNTVIKRQFRTQLDAEIADVQEYYAKTHIPLHAVEFPASAPVLEFEEDEDEDEPAADKDEFGIVDDAREIASDEQIRELHDFLNQTNYNQISTQNVKRSPTPPGPEFVRQNALHEEAVSVFETSKANEAEAEVDVANEKWEEMKRARTIASPYIISVDEYHNSMHNHQKLTLVYFAEDDTLIDEGQNIIGNMEDVVGGEALLNFGLQSDSSHMVYVRHEAQSVDYEVVREDGSYVSMVLDIQDETDIRKSQPARFRADVED